MVYRTRIYYNAEQRAQIWDCWRRGDSITSIGRIFDRPSSSIFNLLERSGGIRPAERTRSSLSLTLDEREEISRGIVSGCSIRSIALSLNRSPSTVSREINRNGGMNAYRAVQADKAAWERSLRLRYTQDSCSSTCELRMAASSSWKLILSILLVAFSGCALNIFNHESGSIVVQYDRSTGICQLYLEYKGNRHQQNLVGPSYAAPNFSKNPLHMYVFSSVSGPDFYGVSGGCVLDPSQDNRLPAVAIIQLAINLPSPHLEVENSKTHRGKTPRALLEEGGFSVKFNNKNESGVTSLPDFSMMS